MSETNSGPLGRRKRPRVPEASRKRAAQACQCCRRVKERCEGGAPCSRCQRLKLSCEVQSGTKVTQAPHGESGETPDDFYDFERIRAMECIVRHYVGDSSIDTASIKQYLSALKYNNGTSAITTQDSANSTSIMTPNSNLNATSGQATYATKSGYSGDLSHCVFFDDVQAKIGERTGNPNTKQDKPVTTTVVTSRTAHLRSEHSVIVSAISSLPPVEVAHFLVNNFFRFATTNYAYLDETSFRVKLERIYLDPSRLTVNDAALLCVMLMVLALGTQFAHLNSDKDLKDALGTKDEIYGDLASPDDSITLAFYHTATTLLSDVLIISSLESVQALLLLGVYTLPIDAAGLSHTYLGIAVRLGVQINMHRQSTRHIDSAVAKQWQNTWWTVYALERRISVLHGMPVALARDEVDVPIPQYSTQQSNVGRTHNLPNFVANVRLTYILEDAGVAIRSVRLSDVETRSSAIASLSRINLDLSEYWNTLPELIFCRDLNPTGRLFRPNIHLSLTYHLIRLFIGRTFIFDVGPTERPVVEIQISPSTWNEARTKLVADCMDSALSIVSLCQLLNDEIGLARASYTEFTSCRTAVLVILARRLQDNSAELQAASEKGLELLRYMSVGIYSASAEKAAINAMELAVRRLNSDANTEGIIHEPSTAYENFRNWAKLWRHDVEGDRLRTPSAISSRTLFSASASRAVEDLRIIAEPTLQQRYTTDASVSNFAFQFDDFVTMPGFDASFNFGLDDLTNWTDV